MAQGSTRFEHLEKSINDYIIKQQNKNTRAKTTRDLKLLIEFLREKHEQRNPQEIEAKELNEYLCEFILSVKQKDGKDFKPSSLRGLFSRFNRHLKECEYPVSVIEDVGFERTRICLEAKNKQLVKEGKGNRPNAAEALSDDEINNLHEKKPPGNFKRRSIYKHTLALQYTAFWSTRTWRASANVLGRRSAHERCRWN